MKAERLREAIDLIAAIDSPDERDQSEEGDESGIEDDRLRLMFTCCHPALPLEGRVAITLRALAGLSTPEIARAFFVSEATMAKRLVRAKGKIVNAEIPYRVPPAHLLHERTSGVPAVLYLLFNEGYTASAGADLIRVDLCGEANPACAGAEYADAGRARGDRAAGADALPALPPTGASRSGGRSGDARGAGSLPLGPERSQRRERAA
jgi:predicted RNA polymerase sigma factor